jgi:hypothetical protein
MTKYNFNLLLLNLFPTLEIRSIRNKIMIHLAQSNTRRGKVIHDKIHMDLRRILCNNEKV